MRKLESRWLVCGLLFLSTALSYYDRQIIGLLKFSLQHAFSWTEGDYGIIVMAFQLAYAVGLLFIGQAVDIFGPILALAASVAVWSVGSASHALAGSVLAMSTARAVLGVAEAGNFPAGVSLVTRLFPAAERALAIGLFNGGSNVGAILGPLTVPLLVIAVGWRGAFITSGLLGAFWVALWIYTFRSQISLRFAAKSQSSTRGRDAVSLAKLVASRHILRQPVVMGLCVTRLLTDSVWTVLVFWAPDFFTKHFGLKLQGLALPLVAVFAAAALGGICGGASTALLISRGVQAQQARLRVMLATSLLSGSLWFAARTTDLPMAVLLVSATAFAHQAWASNLFALPADKLPASQMGAVTGFTGCTGAIGSMIAAGLVGVLLDAGVGYQMIFGAAIVLYTTGWVLLRIATQLQQTVEEFGFSQ